MTANNPFVAPWRGWRGAVMNGLANCPRLKRMRRRLTNRLPVLASDVRDIVYANWVVPTGALASHLPPGVCLIEKDGYTLLTILTYVHGHFGPAFAGRLRGLFPSPLQSNWRGYVATLNGTVPDKPTVLFFRNILDSAGYALGARIFSDAMAPHLAGHFEHRCTNGGCVTRIAGPGSAPELELSTAPGDGAELPPDFHIFFPTWRDAIESLCLQDVALSGVDDSAAIARAVIDLPIDPDSVLPLAVLHFAPGAFLRGLQAQTAPFCFRVPSVHFRVLSEVLLSER